MAINGAVWLWADPPHRPTLNQMSYYVTQDEEMGGGWLDSLVNAASRGSEIYRNLTTPAPATPANPPARTVATPVGNFSPLAIGGAVFGLVLVLWLALRRP